MRTRPALPCAEGGGEEEWENYERNENGSTIACESFKLVARDGQRIAEETRCGQI